MSKQTVADAAKGTSNAKAAGGKKAARPGSKRGPAPLVKKSELAHMIAADITSINKWIAKGTVPPPWARTGPRHDLWLLEHVLEFVRTGQWPKAAFHKRAL